MKRSYAGVALAAALLGSTLAGTALGQDYNSQRDRQDYNSTPDWQDNNSTQDYSRPQDQSDTWRQNQDREGDSRNDGWQSGPGWGRNRSSRTALEGRWVADDRAGDSRFDRGDFRGGRMRGVQLPDFIRIDQRPNMVRITDSRNHVLQQIAIGGRFDPRDEGRNEALVGHWRGPTLVVERSGFRGATITQTFSLEHRGRTLVVRTRRDPVGRGPTTEFSTVYHRA